MKRVLIALLGVAVFFGLCHADGDLDLKSNKAKLNYSVGYQVGSDFRRQGIDVNTKMIIKGVQDALSGNEPLLSPKEMRKILVDLQRKVTAIQEQNMKAQAKRNLAEGKEFLAENAEKEGVVSLPSGLQYKVVAEGSGKTPKANDTVTIHYRGTLIDGTKFDSSYSSGKPATLRADRVIAGWKEALLLMEEGAKWQLFIPPDLGYGERRYGSIEPNSTLIFEVELISIE